MSLEDPKFFASIGEGDICYLSLCRLKLAGGESRLNWLIRDARTTDAFLIKALLVGMGAVVEGQR